MLYVSISTHYGEDEKIDKIKTLPQIVGDFDDAVEEIDRQATAIHADPVYTVVRVSMDRAQTHHLTFAMRLSHLQALDDCDTDNPELGAHRMANKLCDELTATITQQLEAHLFRRTLD